MCERKCQEAKRVKGKKYVQKASKSCKEEGEEWNEIIQALKTRATPACSTHAGAAQTEINQKVKICIYFTFHSHTMIINLAQIFSELYFILKLTVVHIYYYSRVPGFCPGCFIFYILPHAGWTLCWFLACWLCFANLPPALIRVAN